VSMPEQDQNNETAIELGRWLFSQACTFLIGAVNMDDLPKGDQTEIAFAGRSTIADLPGYGYARAPRETVRQWTDLVGDYLQGRMQLRRACLLIDGRHGIKDSDREVMKMLDKSAVSYQVILTKCDKIKPGQLEKLLTATSVEMVSHVAAHPELIATSSAKGTGIETLRGALAALTTEL
jgi:GTP-binding protein